MARVPMVTRTIQTTKANVLCLDIEKGEPFNKYVTLPRTYKDEKSMMKVVEGVINTDTVKAVHIVECSVQETLYGMTEQEFIAHAVILPPRTTTDSGASDSNNASDSGDTNNGNI